MTVVLIGFMGAGKSIVGRALAARTGDLFLDTDELVEEVAGASIDQLWTREGERGFRDREEVAVAAACATPGAVVATGAGAVTRDANRDAIAMTSATVYLTAPLDLLWERASGTAGRPNAHDRDAFDALFAEREPLYRSLARMTVDATAPVEQVAAHIQELLDA